MDKQKETNDIDADIDTATGLLASAVLDQDGEREVIAALTARNPISSLAQFFTQAIDSIQNMSMSTEIPLDPSIWLSTGGPIDEIMKDVAEIAADNNIPFRIKDVLPPLKDKIVEYLSRMKDDFDRQNGQMSAMPARRV